LFLPLQVTVAWVKCVVHDVRETGEGSCVRFEVCVHTPDPAARVQPAALDRALAASLLPGVLPGVRDVRQLFPMMRRCPRRKIDIEVILVPFAVRLSDLLRATFRYGGMLDIAFPRDGSPVGAKLLPVWPAVCAVADALAPARHLLRFTCDITSDAAGTRMVGFTAKVTKPIPPRRASVRGTGQCSRGNRPPARHRMHSGGGRLVLWGDIGAH
jgi:hypothetical protein